MKDHIDKIFIFTLILSLVLIVVFTINHEQKIEKYNQPKFIDKEIINFCLRQDIRINVNDRMECLGFQEVKNES